MKKIDDISFFKNIPLSLVSSLKKIGFTGEQLLLPDAHVGQGFPIGFVGVSKEIYPNALGKDLSCGIAVYSTNQKYTEDVEKNKAFFLKAMLNLKKKSVLSKELTNKLKKQNIDLIGKKQIGTLGRGNHFLEFAYFTPKIKKSFFFKKQIFIVIHTGSRGVGAELQKKNMELIHSNNFFEKITLKDKISDQIFENLNLAKEFALENRQSILDKCKNSFKADLKIEKIFEKEHNFIEQKDTVFIHRKGACFVSPGEIIYIPGNMASGGPIGLVQDSSKTFFSICHGAGRKIRRKDCYQQISYSSVQKEISKKKIYTNLFNESLVEEAPGAYKSINEIEQILIKNKLFSPIGYLTPFVSLKNE